MRFREFIQTNNMEEEKGDIKKTLSKIPPSHAALVQGFKWKFHPGNTLNGDNQHVGYVDDQTKEIAVAAPYNYGREFTILHEIAHKVWERIVPNNMKKVWNQLVLNTPKPKDPKSPLNQNPEEIFCHVYASAYSKHPPVTYYKPEWIEFVKKFT